MRFSVIIPFFNRRHLVGPVLDSVAAQSFADFEVICVDDGSTDATFAALQAHPSKPRCLRIPNAGPGAARNAASKLATGEYLAFLDSDDLWFPFSLALYDQVLSQHNAPSILTALPILFSESPPPPPDFDQPVIESFPNYLSSFDRMRWHGVTSFVIQTAAFHAVGGFANTKMNAEDADLLLKLGCAPGFVFIDAPRTFAYRNHQGNITSNPEACFKGFSHILAAAKANHYPGGKAFARERALTLSRHLRPIILDFIRTRHFAKARTLFLASLPYNFKARKFAFLAFCTLRLSLQFSDPPT